MRKPDRFKRPRSASADAAETPSFDPAALGLATWLAMMVVVRFIQLLPPPPAGLALAASQAWTVAGWGG